jgi:hypothetical protein
MWALSTHLSIIEDHHALAKVGFLGNRGLMQGRRGSAGPASIIAGSAAGSTVVDVSSAESVARAVAVS